MKYVFHEEYTEARHITVDLPEGATEEQVRDAAYGSDADAWDSDEYTVEDAYVTNERGDRLFTEQQ